MRTEPESDGYVVDASVLVSVLLDSGAEGQWSEEVVAAKFLAAPQLAVVETLNILRRLEAAHQIQPLEAASAQCELQDLTIELLPIRPFENRIWELRHNLTCYDAWYVAAAEVLQLTFATLDRRLASASGPRCSFHLPDEA
ncbi:MAG: type II toxin-antitoxin system VapC family toxin [Acidobacteriota bacterium]|nr:type II toxin-antitoxin system VapC family toxin [Acidobacteriota bacterium]